MSRGHRIEKEVDRVRSCANCRSLNHLLFREPNTLGQTGLHFCRVEFRETGAFEVQPWDFTCRDFHDRGRGKIPSSLAPRTYEAV